jgi:hypothetical protein
VVRDQKRSENGYCDFLNKVMAVRPDIAPAQALKTLIHELGHALLHGDEVGRSREIQEVEVESVAYIVCDALGLNTGDYSFAYVARWSDGSTELVKDTAERVVRCAKKILTALDIFEPFGGSVVAMREDDRHVDTRLRPLLECRRGRVVPRRR